MKAKLYISLLACVICVSVAYSQARIILPDSSKITTNPDSLHLLPKKEYTDHDHDHDHEADSLGQHSHLNHLLHDHGATADSLRKMARMSVWRIDPRTLERLPSVPDTILYNYQQSVLPDGQSVAMGFLAPLGSPSFTKIFIDRGETEPFIFNKAYDVYLKRAEDVLFVNTRIPYSRLSYTRSSPKLNREERFQGRLTSNFGKELNVGIDADLINSRGYYNSLAAKHSNFTLFGNYLSDKIEAHAYMNLGTVKNAENGGITNDLFITHPDSMSAQQSFTSRDIPVKFTNTWNSLRNNRYFLSARYNLGYKESSTDSLLKEQGRFIS